MSVYAPDKVLVESAALTVTPLAAAKIKSLLTEKGLTEHGLRVFIAGGGCSGFQYGMAFDNNPQETDHIVEANGVRLIVDAASLPHIDGASIDFIDNPMGGGFRIENPNAVSTCGCGNSFRSASGAPDSDEGMCGCH